jgi:hypothetical protein
MVNGIRMTVAFLLEVAMLVALAYWGFHTGDGIVLKLVFGLGAPVLAGVVWGLFVAPKASHPLPVAGRFVVEVVVFAAGAAALWSAGQRTLAIGYGVFVVLSVASEHLWPLTKGTLTPNGGHREVV